MPKPAPTPFPVRADGRLDTTAMRDRFPILKDFKDKQIASMVFIKAMRLQGQYREFPQFLAVPFTWDEDRGAYEGPFEDPVPPSPLPESGS